MTTDRDDWPEGGQGMRQPGPMPQAQGLRAGVDLYGTPTPAEAAGCCGASSKNTCTRPPCPCNMEAWTPQEIYDLEVARRKEKAGEQ